MDGLAVAAAVAGILAFVYILIIGREKEKRRVHEALKSRSDIIMIDGIGGIGKTSLALEVLHECVAASQNAKIETDRAQKFEASSGPPPKIAN